MDAKLLGSSNIIGDIMIDAYNGVCVPVPLDRPNIASMVASSDEGILLVDVNLLCSAPHVNNSTNARCEVPTLWLPWVALDRLSTTWLRPTRLQRFGAKLRSMKRTKNSVLSCCCLSPILHVQVGIVNRRKNRRYLPSLF